MLKRPWRRLSLSGMPCRSVLKAARFLSGLTGMDVAHRVQPASRGVDDAAPRPAMRPNTMHSGNAHPPSRLAP